MPYRARYSNLDEVITCQHAVIKNLRHTLAGLLDEIEARDDETLRLRLALDAAKLLMERRFPVDRSPGG